MFVRSLFVISILGFAIYWFQVRHTPEDATAYHLLMSENTKERGQKTLEKEPATQKRVGVKKDIYREDGTKLIHIESDVSELTLSEYDKNLELIEELKNIHCVVHDDLTLSADEGIFTFPSNQFTAIQNCHLTQNENKIDGTEIHIDFASEVITYENPIGYLASGEIHFSAKKLIWNKKQDKLYLHSNVKIEQIGSFICFSDEGTLLLNDLQPQELILKNNVRLISEKIQDKMSFAAADTLTYSPIEKTLLFSSDTKVLFWQDGLSLSAKEVMIRDGQTVEGHGDVHFSFDLNEQNYIEELFGQYL